MKQNKTKKQFVIFAGGETAGPVIPLLALAKFWKEQDDSIAPVFVDRKHSIAARLVPKENFTFRTIISGKLRRYRSVRNIVTPLLLLIGFIQSLILLIRLRPIAVIGAGGYIQVPLILAAWIVRIPRFIHQHDIVPTFSNRLVEIFANKITTTFEKSTKDFHQGSGFGKSYDDANKIIWTGSPCDLDPEFLSSEDAKTEARKLFKLEKEFPAILVLGGGSGAMGLNNVIAEDVAELTKTVQIIHSTGPGKAVDIEEHSDPQIHDRYHQYEYIDRRDLAYAAADIVIARAGVSTIVDLSVLGKVSILVPMPNSHQEYNAEYVYSKKAAVVINQEDLYNSELVKVIKKILFDAKLQKALQTNINKIVPKNASEKMLAVILKEINA